MEGPLFGDVVSQEDCPPLVFKYATKEWPALKWTPGSLAKVLQEKLLQCKVAPIDVEGIQWETESLHLMVTLQQYSDWLNGQADQDNPLDKFDPEKFSCYVDYKYMKEMFSGTPSILKDIDWGMFGLEGRDGEDSTIWIGSAGAYTPCHYDTYGFNLVAQLHGRKRWYLFSPKQTSHLYATRIPFEESSVFSEVNIRSPDLRKHSLFKDVEVHIVDLQPGEVLYVPRHWWHFVECLEPSISVNTWIPVREDLVSQYQEAVCRLLFTTMYTALPGDQDAKDYVNANEELQPVSVNLAYMNTALKHLKTQCNGIDKSSRQVCCQYYGKAPENMCQTEQCKSDSEQCKCASEVCKADSEECKCHCEQCKGDSVKDDNFVKFCAAFPGICVTCSLNHHSNSSTSGTKRKLEDTDNAVPVKVKKSVGKVPGQSKAQRNVTDQTCKYCVCDGLTKLRHEEGSIEIFQCSKYSFREYLAFLKENYEYDGNEPENSEQSSTNGNVNPDVTLKDVINSVLQPEVVQHLAEVLQNRVGTIS